IVELFFIGVIASATMIIPGVSGSLVLMLLGFYSGIIETIRDFLDALIAFDSAAILHCVGILLPFGIGIVVGIFAVSKLIEWLFAKFPSVTYSAILGLIVASPIGIFAKMGHNNINAVSIIIGIVLFIVSAWFTYWFGKKTEGIEK
ncbi:MAG: undecaprenyl phosphate translocase family protein, partial [Lachnospiraceae bacterium]